MYRDFNGDFQLRLLIIRYSDNQGILHEHMPVFVVSNVLIENLALLEAWASTDTEMHLLLMLLDFTTKLLECQIYHISIHQMTCICFTYISNLIRIPFKQLLSTKIPFPRQSFEIGCLSIILMKGDVRENLTVTGEYFALICDLPRRVFVMLSVVVACS